MIDKINELKKDLNRLMVEEKKDSNKILQISQELDVLIVEYYRELGIERL